MDTYNYSSPPMGGSSSAGNRIPLAIGAGALAAMVGGALWAIIVLVTNIEIGWAAWGIGFLVALAMAYVTQHRSTQLAYVAAALALAGLLVGKAFIFVGSTNKVADDFLEDQQLMAGALAWHMYEDRALDAPTLEAIDASRAAGDTLSDALWANMLKQGEVKLATMSDDEKSEFAGVATINAMANLGIVGGVKAQLTPFDLLWAFLAIGTAMKMMSPTKEEEAATV